MRRRLIFDADVKAIREEKLRGLRPEIHDEYDLIDAVPDADLSELWIPVEERLPEDDLPDGSERLQLKVLVAIRKENGSYVIRTQTRVRQKFCSAKRFGNWYWGKHAYGDVTHWMPLPGVPKKEDT